MLCLAQRLLPVTRVCLSQHRKQLLGFVSLELKPFFLAVLHSVWILTKAWFIKCNPSIVQNPVLPAHFPALLGEVPGWLRVPEVWNMCHYQPKQNTPTLEFCVHVTSNQESDL